MVPSSCIGGRDHCCSYEKCRDPAGATALDAYQTLTIQVCFAYFGWLLTFHETLQLCLAARMVSTSVPTGARLFPDLSSRIGGRDHFVYHYNMMVRCVSY